MMTEVNELLKSLNDFKNDLDIEIDADTTIIKNELYRGQIEEVNIIIDKVEYILKAESVEWGKIIRILNKVFDSIKEAENLEDLINSIYYVGKSYESQIYPLWKESNEQKFEKMEQKIEIEKEERKKHNRRSSDQDDDLPF